MQLLFFSSVYSHSRFFLNFTLILPVAAFGFYIAILYYLLEMEEYMMKLFILKHSLLYFLRNPQLNNTVQIAVTAKWLTSQSMALSLILLPGANSKSTPFLQKNRAVF